MPVWVGFCLCNDVLSWMSEILEKEIQECVCLRERERGGVCVGWCVGVFVRECVVLLVCVCVVGHVSYYLCVCYYLHVSDSLKHEGLWPEIQRSIDTIF